MTGGPQVSRLSDGDRLHLNHGPIDLIIDAEGPDRELAFAAASHRFQTILQPLADELSVLTARFEGQTPVGPVAQRMVAAISPLADQFVTPMAAVAGAVADEVLAHLVADHSLSKASVNNGGDIAFHLSEGRAFRVVCPAGTIEVQAGDPVRGIATSGWRGRSQSFGIADAVTVLAGTAARADVAATLIANAVDLPGHPAVQRTPAEQVEAIPQLGARLVTTGVGDLTQTEVDAALERGAEAARDMCSKGLITGAVLLLDGQTRVIGCAGNLPELGVGPS